MSSIWCHWFGNALSVFLRLIRQWAGGRNLDLKTKITAVCIGLFVVATWLLAHDLAEEVRDDFQAVTSAQQLALVDHIVASLDEDVKLRIGTLQDIASSITSNMMGDADQLRLVLREYKQVDRLFDNGLWVISKSGIGLVDYPAVEGRSGSDFSEADYFQKAMATGEVTIGRPRIGKLSHKPVVIIAAPIRNGNNQIIGVLSGSISISESSFFNEIVPPEQTLEGWFHLVSPQERIFINSTQQSRILQPIPEKGINRLLDRFVGGYEGSGITINSRGMETLSSARHMATTGWLVISSNPTKIAFAPINKIEFEIYKDAAMSSLLIAGILWFFIYHQLRPLGRSARIIDEMASGERPLTPLPVEGGPEIRQLLGSFNKFQAHIKDQKKSLQDSADQLQLAASVFDGTSECVAITDPDTKIIRVNKAFCRMTGYEMHQLIGKNPKLLKSGCHDTAFYAEMWGKLINTGEWSGEIWNRRRNGELYAERLSISSIYDDDGKVKHRVAIASDITAQKESERVIWHQANHDRLTSLPNRPRFRELLEKGLVKAKENNLFAALLVVDLDRFKEVNDTMGHAIGDSLLIETAERIKSAVLASDIVGHLGVDEFVVALPDLSDCTRADVASESIRDAISRPFLAGAETVYLTASIGITTYPLDGTDIDVLFQNLDQALQEAKVQGRNRVCRFNEAMLQVTQTRQKLGHDLRFAITDKQLEVYYQPIVAMDNRAIVKAEALLRWRHPERGFVSPALFIPIAEETGLINEIGEWVFCQAAAMARRLCDRCPNLADGQCRREDLLGEDAPCLFQIAVNKSPRQFFTGATHEDWPAHLRHLKISPRCISVEVTEGLLLDGHAEVIKRMSKFREAGMQIAIDDFGTGYSALSYLNRFDIDCIKIDQSFVRDLTDDPGDRAIAEAIIMMAHRLGMKVVAEGIETEDQYNILAAAGCDFGQGYLFAKPMPAQQFYDLLGSLSWDRKDPVPAAEHRETPGFVPA